jgi:excisionase family DNA binding protein
MSNVASKKADEKPNCDSDPGRSQAAPKQRWMTIEQIAARYQLSVRTIANMMEDGRLPYYKVGRSIRFDPEECDLAMRAFRRASKFDTFVETEAAITSTNAPETENADSLPSRPVYKPRKPAKPVRPVQNESGDSGREGHPRKHKKPSKTATSEGKSHHLDAGHNSFAILVEYPNKTKQNTKMNGMEKTTKTTKTGAFLVTPWQPHMSDDKAD